MNNRQKEELKKKILTRNILYEMQGSRVRRLVKDPIRTFTFYVMQAFGYFHPYKVNYRTLWGSSMSFYLPEGGMVYYYGFWEANLTNFFINFLKDGDIFLDVGAHVGYYSVLASDLVGKSGQVHSFEPTPRTFESLKENAKNKNTIKVYNNAILDKETTIDFYDYGPKYSAFNTFKKRTAKEITFRDEVSKISVKTISLDHFCKKGNISPTFIKIDAEGSEYLILGAMKFILEKHKPIVSIEVSSNKEWEENIDSSFKTFEQYGYTSYEIDINGMIEKCDARKVRLYDNLLFIHPSKLDSVRKLIK